MNNFDDLDPVRRTVYIAARRRQRRVLLGICCGIVVAAIGLTVVLGWLR